MTRCEDCANFKPKEKPVKNGTWILETNWKNAPVISIYDDEGIYEGHVGQNNYISISLRKFLISFS